MVSLCVTTAYTKSFAVDIGDFCAATLRLYAGHHNLALCVVPDMAFPERPPSWFKLKLIPELFKKGFDFVLWVDADALFMRYDRDIREVVEDGKDLYMVCHNVHNALIPNCGVMLFRNCAWTSDLLARMWALERYVDHPWWENAALLHLFGCHRLLNEGPDRLDAELIRHVKFIDVGWNALPNFCTVDDPMIHHYAGQPRIRAQAMKSDYIKSSLRAFERLAQIRSAPVKAP
jgi:hypothetical protein